MSIVIVTPEIVRERAEASRIARETPVFAAQAAHPANNFSRAERELYIDVALKRGSVAAHKAVAARRAEMATPPATRDGKTARKKASPTVGRAPTNVGGAGHVKGPSGGGGNGRRK